MKKKPLFIRFGSAITAFLFSASLLCCVQCQERKAVSAVHRIDTIPPTHHLHLLFTGDIMAHLPQVADAWDAVEQKYDFAPVFDAVLPYFRNADFVVGNLETTFGGKPYSGYPMFSTPDALAYDLKTVGFDALTTANNHACDRKNKGVVRTLDVLEQAGIRSTGTFRSEEDRRERSVLWIDTLGVKVALLAYTYGTNGMPFSPPVRVNLIDTLQMGEDIDRAKEGGADFVVVSMHWGEEYQLKPTKMQQRQAQWLANRGADAIVGMHPHVVQPSDTLVAATGKQVPVVYSLGNFISNQYRTYTQLGKMLALRLSFRKGERLLVTEWKEHYTFVARRIENARRRYLIVPTDSMDKYLPRFSEEDKAAWKHCSALIR